MSEQISNLATSNKLLACMLEPVSAGASFASLPLHVTVLHWFSVDDRHLPALNNRWINLAHDIEQFAIRGGARDMFGVNNDVPVTKLARSGKLFELHRNTSEAVQTYGGVIASEFIGDKYNPHVSDTKTEALACDEEVILKAMQLITKLEDGTRVVKKNYYFRDPSRR